MPRAGFRGRCPTRSGAAPRRNAPKPDVLWRWRISTSTVREPLQLAGTGGRLSDPRPDRSALKRRRLPRSFGVFLPPFLRPPRPTKRDPLSGTAVAGVPNCRTALRSADAAFSDVASLNRPAPVARNGTRGAGQPGRALQAGSARLRRLDFPGRVRGLVPLYSPIAHSARL